MKNLYKEGLKQIRTLGFISLAIMTLLSIIIPVQHYLSALELNHNAVSGFKSGVSTLSGGFHLYLLFCIIAPIMVLVIFNFLNHRNSSDYYHSIPHKRTTLFASYFLAVITWVLIILITSVIISSALYLFFSDLIMFSISEYFFLAINIFVACFLVTSLIALAMSITGTLVSNLIISLILIFIPRILIEALSIQIVEKFQNIYNGLFPLLSYKYNAVFLLLGEFLDYPSYSLSNNTNSFSSTTIYTFIISFIFLLVALYFFKHRKSETAEKSTQSLKIQKIFAITIGLVFCIYPIIRIFNEIVLSKTKYYTSIFNFSNIFTIIIFYILCFVAMFLYEFITTFKVKSALKTFTFAPIIFLLNFFVLTLMVLIFNFYKDYSPNPDKVDSVNIIIDGDFSIFSNLTYENAKLYDIDFTDKKLINLLTKADKNYTSAKSAYFSGSNFILYNNIIKYPQEINNSNDYIKTLVSFNSSFSKSERIVYLTKDMYNELLSILENSSEYVSTYKSLPRLSNTVDVYMSNEDKPLAKKLYTSLREELNEMDFDDFAKALINNNDLNSAEIITSLQVSTSINGTYYSKEYPISIHTKKTLEKYLELKNSNSKNLNLLKDILTNTKYENVSIDIAIRNIVFSKKESTMNQYSFVPNKGFENIDMDYLLDNLTNSFSLNDKSTIVSLNITYQYDDSFFFKELIFLANENFLNEQLLKDW